MSVPRLLHQFFSRSLPARPITRLIFGIFVAIVLSHLARGALSDLRWGGGEFLKILLYYLAALAGLGGFAEAIAALPVLPLLLCIGADHHRPASVSRVDQSGCTSGHSTSGRRLGHGSRALVQHRDFSRSKRSLPGVGRRHRNLLLFHRRQTHRPAAIRMVRPDCAVRSCHDADLLARWISGAAWRHWRGLRRSIRLESRHAREPGVRTDHALHLRRAADACGSFQSG